MKCDVLRWRWAPSTADEAAASVEAGIPPSYRELSQFQLSGMPLAYPASVADEQRAEAIDDTPIAMYNIRQLSRRPKTALGVGLDRLLLLCSVAGAGGSCQAVDLPRSRCAERDPDHQGGPAAAGPAGLSPRP